MKSLQRSMVDRTIERGKALNQASEALLASSLDDVFSRVTQNASQAFQSPVCVLLLKEGELLSVKAQMGVDGLVVGEQIPLLGTISGKLLRRGEPLLVGDVGEYFGVDAESEPYYYGSLISAPLVFASNVIGLINCARPKGAVSYTRDHLQHLWLYSSQVAVALETLRLLDERTRTLVERERALRESERRYRLLAENAADVIWTLDGEGSFTYVSPSAERLTGYEPQRLEGKPINDILVPQSAQYAARVLRDIDEESSRPDQQSSPRKLELEIVRADGSTLWTETIASSLTKGLRRGERGVICVTRDITERRRAEATLRESESRFRDISFSIADWIWEMDTACRYTFTSGIVEQILGYAPSQLLGRTPFDLMSDEEARRGREIFDRCAELREPIVDFKSIQHTAEGRQVRLLTNGVPIIDERGRLAGYRGVNKDITESTKAEEEKQLLGEQLRQSQKMEAIGRLAGGVAHDMNNVLGAIMALATTLDAEASTGNPVHEDYQAIIESCRRGRSLTRNLLGYARKGRLERKRVSINGLVREIEELLSRTIPKKIELRTDLTPNDATVMGDHNQLAHALMNVCINAEEAMDGSGVLSIRTDLVEHRGDNLKPGMYVRLSVSDTGVGMSKEDLERAFEPFFTTKPKEKGTGLGLSMVYGTVDNHGGTVKLDSRHGEGTTVSILLPLTTGVESERVGPAAEEYNRRSILLVDDEPIIRRAGKRMLNNLGFDVLLASNGREGVDLFLEHRESIDLVILDMKMPVMDGEETFFKLKECDPEVKVIIASGYSSDESLARVMAGGAKAFLQKPFGLQQVKSAIAEL